MINIAKNKISDIMNMYTKESDNKGHDKLSKFQESSWLVKTNEHLIYYYLSSRIIKSNPGQWSLII